MSKKLSVTQRLSLSLSPSKKTLFRWRIMLAIIISLIVWGCMCYIRTLDTYKFFEAKCYDLRMQKLAKHQKPHPDIALVTIDDSSLDFFEEDGAPWPWPRSIYIPVFNMLKKGGAKVVAFDITFGIDLPGFEDQSPTLAEAMKENVPCVLALVLKNRDPGNKENIPFPEDIELEIKQNPLKKYNRVNLPLKVLADQASMLGNVIVAADPDGIYRKIPPFAYYQKGKNKWAPGLALSMALTAQKTKKVKWNKQGLWLDKTHFSVDRQGKILLRYPGRIPGSFRRYPRYSIASLISSYQQLEEGEKPQLDPKVFKDKYVIVLATAPDLYDLRPTPVDDVLPGGEIHAVFLDNILQKNPMSQVTNQTEILVLGVMALLTGITIGLFVNPWLEIFISIMWVLVFYYFNFFLFLQGAYIELLGPCITIIIVSLTVLLSNYLTEGKSRKFLKNAFSQYTNPALVDAIISSPEKLRLGGDRKVISVFFSDLANFTSISENKDPGELVMFLTEYLSEMTEIILSHNGTVDKYQGDAIMAFWGAPLDQEKHATYATLAALESQQKMIELRREFKKKNFPPFSTRIGINSGPALVGNIGGRQRFEYTAIGDTVNLASRLEGANKIFKTGILIGDNTNKQIKETIATRMLGKLVVKGKNIAETVYEPIASFENITDEQKTLVDLHSEALLGYYKRDFKKAQKTFEKILEEHPQDGPAQVYISLCKEYLKSPPPENWDGIIKLSTK